MRWIVARPWRCRRRGPARRPGRRSRSAASAAPGSCARSARTPAARACSAWARPISPPSAVTAALFDMFCGLNGRTRRPRRVKRRAQARDEQRLADVGARALEHEGLGRHQNSMPSCAFTPAAKGCFTSAISVTRSAASISSALALRPVTTTCRSGRRACSAGHHLGEVEVVVAQRDVELVEHEQPDGRVGHQLLGLLPGALGGGDVAGAVLRLPGEAFAQRVPGTTDRGSAPAPCARRCPRCP